MALPARSTALSPASPEFLRPPRDFDDLHRQIGQLMEEVWSGTPFGNGGPWAPVVDVEEAEDAWIVEAELPGVKKKDVNVEMRDSELEISGEIKERERKGILRRRTRRTGRFDYRVTLSGQVDADKIDADLNDGVLTVRIPKSDHDRARRIEVKSGKS
jgi:HSP20 family protein